MTISYRHFHGSAQQNSSLGWLELLHYKYLKTKLPDQASPSYAVLPGAAGTKQGLGTSRARRFFKRGWSRTGDS